MFGKLLLLLAVGLLAWAVVVRPLAAHGPRQTYVVRPYDTLWSIATSHYAGDPRGAVWEIQQRNHLGGGTLRPGQTLVLP